jgi:hypothetical protein
LFVGCAHTPIPTILLTNKVTAVSNVNTLHFSFIDARSEQFKTENYFMLQSVFPIIRVYTWGDPWFDVPLIIAFEKMFLKRFTDNDRGYQTEIKLTSFYFTYQPHELSAIPFINIFVIAADREYHGVVKMEVAVLDKNGKYIFTKIYDADIKEMKSGNKMIYEDGFDMLEKAFMKVTDDLETDLKRIRFD